MNCSLDRDKSYLSMQSGSYTYAPNTNFLVSNARYNQHSIKRVSNKVFDNSSDECLNESRLDMSDSMSSFSPRTLAPLERQALMRPATVSTTRKRVLSYTPPSRSTNTPREFEDDYIQPFVRHRTKSLMLPNFQDETPKKKRSFKPKWIKRAFSWFKLKPSKTVPCISLARADTGLTFCDEQRDSDLFRARLQDAYGSDDDEPLCQRPPRSKLILPLGRQFDSPSESHECSGDSGSKDSGSATDLYDLDDTYFESNSVQKLEELMNELSNYLSRYPSI